MSIEMISETYKKVVGTRMFQGRCWAVMCDYCKKSTIKNGTDPGEASDAALREGFTRVSTGFTMPMKWACPSCTTKRAAKKA